MPRVKKEETEKKTKKKMKPIQSIKGTKDILPPEQFVWDHILRSAATMCENFGFGRIETPIMESTDLFKRGVGQVTDIVEKEMFSFETQGGDKVSLRPEGTAGVVRSYIENGMSKWTQPVRLYYAGAMFRYDKPQKGRYRQFHQIDAEVFGEKDPAVDAEIIEMADTMLRILGVTGTETLVNSVGCKTCRPAYARALRTQAEKVRDGLCEDCRRKIETNPLRIFDCKAFVNFRKLAN